MPAAITIAFNNQTMANGGGAGLANSEIFLSLTGAVGPQGTPVNTFYTINPDGTTTGTTSPTVFTGFPLSSLPLNTSNQPFLTVDGSQNLQSARLYFSNAQQILSAANWQSGPTPSNPTATLPSSTDFVYDFIEFAQPSGSGLNVDTTQVDQVGFPTSVNVVPADGSYPNGSGIIPTLDRNDLFAEYRTAMSVTINGGQPFLPFLDAIITGPTVGGSTDMRILSPQHVIETQLAATLWQGNVAASTGSPGNYTTTLTITGPNQPANGGLQGKYVSGPGLPAGAVVSALVGTNQVTISSMTPATAFAGGTYNFYNAPATLINSWFGPSVNSTGNLQSNAIDSFFNFWKAGGLKLEANFNGTNLVYTGITTTATATDITGNTSTYTVLQFSNPADGTYNIYYPYFTTNSPAGKLDPFGNPVPAPPSWFNQLKPFESPSQMVFGADGVFSDNALQDPSTYTGKSSTILGAFENAVVTALARGYGTTWQFGSATNFTKQSNTQATFTLNSLAGLNLVPNQTYVSSFQIGLPMLITAVDAATSTITVQTSASFANIGAIGLPELLTFYVPYQTGQTFSPYAAFLHNTLSDTITIDGRAYALPFDDQGGFSTDLNTSANGTILVRLNPWSAANQTAPLLAVGQGATGAGTVIVGGQTFTPFLGFDGGVRTSLGDANRDGVPDLVFAAGEGGGPHVVVLDGTTGSTLLSFFAYEADFQGGVFVAAGDVNKDGHLDIITGPGVGGGPVVKVFSGKDGTLLASFFAYDPSFRGGVRVAVGDLNGDGYADIVVAAGPGGGPHVSVFDGFSVMRGDGPPKVLASFLAYREDYRGGTFVSLGDVRGDGGLEIITGTDQEVFVGLPAATGRQFEGPKVGVFDADGSNRLTFQAFPGESGSFSPSGFYGGVRVATRSTPDGKDVIVTASGAGTIPELGKAGVVRVFDASGDTPTQVGDDLVPFGDFLGGLYVAGT